jgi:hypothetical protein
MKKIHFLIVILSFLGQLYSASIAITSPRSADQWCRGNKYKIQWTSTSNVYPRVKIRLYRAGQRIMGIVDDTENDGEYEWKIPVGLETGVYNIRVKALNNLHFDDSDQFKIEICPQTSNLPMLQPAKPPALSKLIINNGAESTRQVRVTLNHQFSRLPGLSGKPTHYRARNMLTTSTWSAWKRYQTAPNWNLLPNICGIQKVFFQLKNRHGESNVVADIINYKGRESTYKIPVGAAMNLAKMYGFTHTARALDSNCELCEIPIVTSGQEKIACLLVQQKVRALGAKGEFIIFGGKQLNPGWKFVSYSINTAFSDVKNDYFAGYRLLSQPAKGSRNITLKARVWRGGAPNPIRTAIEGIAGLIIPPSSTLDISRANWIQIHTITLKGPCGRDWKEAFMR